MPEELNCVADAIAKRGDALDLNRLFMQTPVPMVLIRNDLHVHDANPAGQLYLRRRVADLRRTPVYTVPARQRAEFRERWAALLRDQAVTRNAMSRLGARNPTQAFALALRAGEIGLP